jgi:hypothetical protein
MCSAFWGRFTAKAVIFPPIAVFPDEPFDGAAFFLPHMG